MSAQPIRPAQPARDDDLLDPDTSAAVLRWMETSTIPEGVERGAWERWLDGGCVEALRARGNPITSAMLGRWARSGYMR